VQIARFFRRLRCTALRRSAKRRLAVEHRSTLAVCGARRCAAARNDERAAQNDERGAMPRR